MPNRSSKPKRPRDVNELAHTIGWLATGEQVEEPKEDKSELLKRTPGVDANLLRESQRLGQRLKESGFKGARYRLASPMTDKSGKALPPSDAPVDQHAHHRTRRH